MYSRAAALIGSLLIAFSSVVGAQESPSVSVRIAKTARSVSPFGIAEGGSGPVTVRFSKYKNNRWRLLSKSRVPVADDGSYVASFRRPEQGSCRAVARYSGVRDQEVFPCYIPDFPGGSVLMSSVTTEVEIRALIAKTDEHRGYGLMYRPKLADDLGMAFLWESDTSGGFWMKNTLIPLSIAFFDSNGTIVRILDMEPCSEEPCQVYNPGVSYRGALEVNQGSFDEWGISEGDHIEVSADP